MFSFDFLTIDLLMTPLGLVLAVALITQFTKDLWDKIKKVPTKYIVYLYSIIIMFIVAALTVDFAGYTWKNWLGLILITVLNAIVVTFAAMKSYEGVESYILKKLTDKGTLIVNEDAILPSKFSDHKLPEIRAPTK